MNEIVQKTGEQLVDVRLVGGPADFPEARRTLRIDLAQAAEKIKIKYYGGYQHFVPSGEDGGHEPRIFRWAGATKIAE
jgi:hypothetical protein